MCYSTFLRWWWVTELPLLLLQLLFVSLLFLLQLLFEDDGIIASLGTFIIIIISSSSRRAISYLHSTLLQVGHLPRLKPSHVAVSALCTCGTIEPSVPLITLANFNRLYQPLISDSITSKTANTK